MCRLRILWIYDFYTNVHAMFSLISTFLLALAAVSVPTDVEANYSLAAIEDTLEATGRALLVRRRSAPRFPQKPRDRRCEGVLCHMKI